jgi:conjugal transfer pilus assembly protein TraW
MADSRCACLTHRGVWLIATLALGAIASAAIAQGVTIQRSTIGRTWPIAEPDALAEIEAKVATLPHDMRKQYGSRRRWSALKAAALPPAPVDRVRKVIPFYTLEFDIQLPDGRVVYPKGYTFNPLTYVKLPQRLVIVHPRDLAWALKVARATDFILLSALGSDSGDAIELGERNGRAIYILEERVKARLGLRAAPVIVAQSGTQLVLTEFGPKSRSLRGGSR